MKKEVKEAQTRKVSIMISFMYHTQNRQNRDKKQTRGYRGLGEGRMRRDYFMGMGGIYGVMKKFRN